MPGPSFSTPRSVKPSVPRKRFTLSQANNTLPLVKRIVADVVRTHERAIALQAQLEDLEESHQAQRLQSELDLEMQRLKIFVGELVEIGCDVKDYKTGLIDFTGQHQGRDVNLCWRLGEEKIGYWHEMTAGFAGRKPVSSLIERA